MKYTTSTRSVLILFTFITILFSSQCKANASPRQLDSLLQDYAYRALQNPKSGIIYKANIPSNLTGIHLQVIRLKSGSLKFRGFKDLEEFEVPSGVVIKPYVVRLSFVYQNLGNWSTFYYPLPGYSYLTPIVGLLAYDAGNLNATNLSELDIVATQSPILVRFSNVGSVPDGVEMKCVWFNLNGDFEFQKMVSPNVCSTYKQGHFAIVVNNIILPPSPSPSSSPIIPENKKKEGKVWEIVVGVVCGVLILALIVFCIVRNRKMKRVKKMEEKSNANETLQMAHVGGAQAPFAPGTRTQPELEQEYLPK